MRSVDSIRQANRIGCVSQCDVDIEWGKGEKKLTIVFISRPRLDTEEMNRASRGCNDKNFTIT